MNLLSDIITYVRRIIKSPSDSVITNDLIIDYINRFWMMDVDARVQLFDLKTTYRFQSTPGIDQYNMPLYTAQTEPGNQTIGPFPVYQGFLPYASVNGIQVPFYTLRQDFWNLWPNYLQTSNSVAVGTGDVKTVYELQVPYFPAIPGHVDMTGIISYYNATSNLQDPIYVFDSVTASQALSSIPTTSIYSGVYFTATGEDGRNIVVADTGIFLQGSNAGDLYGILMSPGNAPFGNTILSGGYSTTSNTINYNTGVAYVNFPTAIPEGTPINAQCYFYNQGLPRGLMYYNNVLWMRPPPNISYLIEVDAYLSPAAFLNTNAAIPFAYMAEYIARGAARKILSDTGDVEQFNFYEPFFREQETLVWKRSQRQFTATRTPTLFSGAQSQNLQNSSGTGFQ